jgi:hypothetical protein
VRALRVERRYWTAADQAELEVGIWELVSVLDDHRPRCDACAAGWPPCPVVGKAIDALLEWRERRALVSKAEALRRRHLFERLDEIQGALAA